jgi:hypothetical protein
MLVASPPRCANCASGNESNKCGIYPTTTLPYRWVRPHLARVGAACQNREWRQKERSARKFKRLAQIVIEHRGQNCESTNVESDSNFSPGFRQHVCTQEWHLKSQFRQLSHSCPRINPSTKSRDTDCTLSRKALCVATTATLTTRADVAIVRSRCPDDILCVIDQETCGGG